MEINECVYVKALDRALKVDFLATGEEAFLYASALYSAMMWGIGIDEKNKAFCNKDGFVE